MSLRVFEKQSPNRMSLRAFAAKQSPVQWDDFILEEIASVVTCVTPSQRHG